MMIDRDRASLPDATFGFWNYSASLSVSPVRIRNA
jgi:hypothetical protein